MKLFWDLILKHSEGRLTTKELAITHDQILLILLTKRDKRHSEQKTDEEKKKSIFSTSNESERSEHQILHQNIYYLRNPIAPEIPTLTK